MNRRPATRYELAQGEPRIYTVTEIANEVNYSLQDSFPNVVVQGEVSGWKPYPSGHIYFDLKDAKSKLRVSLFKSRVRKSHDAIENGIVVQVEGHLEFYGPKGELALIAERVAPLGYGALQAEFDRLKKRLEAEGLFRQDRKRALPAYPTRVGIVTSPKGAALRDMLRVLHQRAPYVRVTVVPAAVQGQGASEEIVAGIELLNEWGRVDVILAGRGGGSLEDLWAFNEERVVRAIVASRIPVISAVGHEVDVTLADFAADVRAATPTHAAQIAAPAREEVRAQLDRLSTHAAARLDRELRGSSARLVGMANHHALRRPMHRIQGHRRDTDDLSDRLERGLTRWVSMRKRRLEGFEGVLKAHTPGRSLERARERVQALAHRAQRCASEHVRRARELTRTRAQLLASYDYHGVLRRGYALVWREGRQKLIQRGRELEPQETVEVQFEDTRAAARILEIRPADAKEGA